MTYIANASGTYFTTNEGVLSKDEALKLAKDCGLAIIKPTVGSSSGQNVQKLDIHNGIDINTGRTLEDIIAGYGENFCLQECLKQSSYLAKICEQSVNTFRIITYICNGKIFHAPVAMRIGSGSSFVDNIHAGGMTIGVEDNGDLCPVAFGEYGDRFTTHPTTNVQFEGYNIPYVPQIIEVAEKLHSKIPHMGMISWDWTLDENNIPVVIEVNLTGQSIWFPQMTHGKSFFGDNTEYFANIVKQYNGRQ